LATFARGGFVVVLGSDGHGEEGGAGGTCSCSVAMAAEYASADRVAFMIRHSTGILSACLDAERREGFGLDTENAGMAGHLASVDFLPGSASGTSARDRANTLKALCDTSNSPASFRSPGHIFLLSPSKGGVLEEPRTTEAICDLCRLAGQVTPVGALAELMLEDGEPYTAEHPITSPSSTVCPSSP
jgi:3,4-dihydroxy-2-butanone 4-phosphate synthase